MQNPQLSQIQTDLPNCPSEVIEQWLLPHASRHGFGWPPTGEAWASLLAGRPLQWWAKQSWHKEALPMTLDTLSSVTQFQVAQIVQAATAKQDYLPDSRARIARVHSHMADHGTWPLPVIGFPDVDGLALIDGFHRMAALTIARDAGALALQERHAIWIALP